MAPSGDSLENAITERAIIRKKDDTGTSELLFPLIRK